jgi:ferric iron reductase protein FhuF
VLSKAPTAAVTTALRRAARINDYFLVHPEDDGGSDWRPLPSLLDELPAQMAARLGYDNPRVVASILFQGYAARLWSPTLACVLFDGILPDLTSKALSWRYRDGEPIGLLLSPVAGWWMSTGKLDMAVTAQILHSVVITHHLDPLAASIRSRVSISERLLWGNAASALAGAARAIGQVAAPLTAALLSIGKLAGTGSFNHGVFTRHSCCLFYRIPGGGTCSDCILRTRPSG